MITPTIVFAGLIGAIAWNLITWYFGLPSSSSHALIGGVVGSAVAAAGFDAVLADGLVGKVLIPAVIAPILAFVVAGIAIGLVYRIVGRQRPGTVTRGFRYGQIVSGGLLALAHGTNDAQKTMGVITLALIANGTLAADADPPFWVIASSATAIALGTYSGGWRIIKTTGTRIIKMDAAQGFSAQGAGAAVILASTHFGFPLSTTHVINGGVMGAGAGKRLSAVRWGVAGNIVFAWLLTLPAAAAIGAAHLRRHADLRHRGARAGAGHPDGALAGRRRLRAPGRARRPGATATERDDAATHRRDQGAAGDGRRLAGRRGRRHLRLLGRDLGGGAVRRAQPQRAARWRRRRRRSSAVAGAARRRRPRVVLGIIVMTSK